ncbi:MAG TPA: aminotransferase class V-fold PLP-dependent enzyme [Solirubrobacteraceae bacterium]|nr:aminotransferase class V-fold PLP-dependent enzyme [Solirubrobacteraceae bacterium]
MIDIGSQRGLFDVPAEVAYFNTANMSPILRSVRAAGTAALALRAEPWRIASDDWFTDVERLRAAYARILGVDTDAVALVPASSYGLAVAARNIAASAGAEVVVLADEYPSNHYTWRRFCQRTGAELVIAHRDRETSWAEAVVAALGERTRVVAVPHVHWTDGSLVDLEAVVAAARRFEAAVVIDASQSLGALPLDVSRLRPDFVVSVGYKWLLGPLGVGCLYVDERYRGGEPLEENWINRAGTEDFAALVDYTDAYRPGARRFDVGARANFGLVPMALAAAEQLLEWTTAATATSLRGVTDRIAEVATSLGYSIGPRDERAPHMLGVGLPREAASAIANDLAERGVIASVRGSSLRIAPHLHTTPEDLERLAQALEAAVR